MFVLFVRAHVLLLFILKGLPLLLSACCVLWRIFPFISNGTDCVCACFFLIFRLNDLAMSNALKHTLRLKVDHFRGSFFIRWYVKRYNIARRNCICKSGCMCVCVYWVLQLTQFYLQEASSFTFIAIACHEYYHHHHHHHCRWHHHPPPSCLTLCHTNKYCTCAKYWISRQQSVLIHIS